MNVLKIYGIKNWVAIAGGKNGGVKINFLEKVTLMIYMFVVNPVTTTLKVKKVSRLQRKKSQMQTAWVHKQNLHFCIKCEKFFCLTKKKNCFKHFTKAKSTQIVM